MDITPIITGLISLCVLILTIVVIPKIKANTDSEKYNKSLIKIDTLVFYAKVVCDAMEKMFPGESEKKLEEATGKIKAWASENNLCFNEVEIRGAIEQAVKEINKEARQ